MTKGVRHMTLPYSRASARLRLLLTLALVVGLSVAVPGRSAADDGAGPGSLTVNGLAAPVDIDTRPRFGWHVNTTAQTAYEIRVSEALSEATDADVWSSGKVTSAQQNDIVYEGPGLDAASRYVWTVRTWDGEDNPSAWADAAEFGTGPGSVWQDSVPIWADGSQNWADYTFTGTFTILQNAASVTFRATSPRNFYLWQFRADTNTLKTHQNIDGAITVIDEISLNDHGVTLSHGQEHSFSIRAEGSTVSVAIDGTAIQTREGLDLLPDGGIGFRTGGSERALFDDIAVTDLGGEVLYTNDFSGPNVDWPGLEIQDGKLLVDTGKNEVHAGTWANYTVSTTLTIDQVALGIRFRAPDQNNSYMWQFRADNRLVPHKQVGGVLDGNSVIKSVALPEGTLAAGKTVDVRIEAVSSTIRTYIDDVLVDTTVDTQFGRGGIGVRTGGTETGRLDEISVVSTDGLTLLTTSFADGDRTMACGTVSGGQLSVPTGTACLNTGLDADWVFLRSDFDLPDKEIGWASVYATGADSRPSKQHVYKLYLNGEFVILGPTRPIGDEGRYDGVDVTDRLRSGEENALAALAYTSAGRKFQAELHIVFTDGTRQVVGTDSSWRVMDGSDTFPSAGSIGTSYYQAPKEYIDARDFPAGFTEPGYDDGEWPTATVTSAIADLRSTPMGKVQERRYQPIEIVEKGEGHYFVDFGRTWVGGLSWRVENGIAGEQIDVRFGETTTAEHTVRYNLHAGNEYREFYTMRDGEQQFETFGMRVFRYVEVIGVPEELTTENFQALALVYPFDREAAGFDSSDENLNAVWELSRNTIEALNVNFYVDTWTRERINYEADAYLQQMSSLYLMDDLSLGIYSMDYFKQNRTWPTEWPMYVLLSVHDAWLQTGRTEQLHDYYSDLQAKLPEQWFEESTGLIRKTTRSDGCGSQTDCDIVDWPVSQRDGYQFRQYNTVINALSYRAYRDMAAIAAEIGESADAESYAQRALQIRTSMNERLYDSVNGRYHDGMDADGTLTTNFSIHASAFPLAFGIPGDDQAGRVAEFVESKGMACSVYCAPFVLSGLYDADNGQAALNLLTSEEQASWMNMIKLGAGATMESWDPSMKSNLTFSHPWAASPAFMVPSGVFGIQTDSPGYASFRVHPQPGDLEWGSVSVPTVRGQIATAFVHDEDGAFHLAVNVPGNSQASLRIPVAEDAEHVYLNGYQLDVEPRNGYATVDNLQMGCYLLGESAPAGVLDDERLRQVCSEWSEIPDVVVQIQPEAVDGWYPGGTVVSLSASDGLAVEYRVEPETSWSDYAESLVFDDEGDHVLEYRVAHPGGGTGAVGSTTLRIDTSAPTVDAAIDAERRVSIAAEDALSGLGHIEFRLDGGAWQSYGRPFVVGGDISAVEYRATDVVGNVSPVSRLSVGEEPVDPTDPDDPSTPNDPTDPDDDGTRKPGRTPRPGLPRTGV